MPRVMTSVLISANGHQTIDRRAAFISTAAVSRRHA
jgi:hypothetical protein